MKKNLYKEYKKKKEIKEQFDEEIIFNEDNFIIKLFLFLFGVFNKIFSILFYIGIIILCSIGATFIANKLGIINIF